MQSLLYSFCQLFLYCIFYTVVNCMSSVSSHVYFFFTVSLSSFSFCHHFPSPEIFACGSVSVASCTSSVGWAGGRGRPAWRVSDGVTRTCTRKSGRKTTQERTGCRGSGPGKAGLDMARLRFIWTMQVSLVNILHSVHIYAWFEHAYMFMIMCFPFKPFTLPKQNYTMLL